VKSGAAQQSIDSMRARPSSGGLTIGITWPQHSLAEGKNSAAREFMVRTAPVEFTR